MTTQQTAIDLVIESKTRELTNDFKIRRVLPSVKKRMVGPFIFFDQMGPEILSAGSGLDVAPHPHIGLATVTYLFAGELLHRDSLGTKQMIAPGAVNWMTAGGGIAHSERTPFEVRKTAAQSELFGVQVWVALPKEAEETAPDFCHYEAEKLPVLEGDGKIVRVIAGSFEGKSSPVKTHSPLFYADAVLEKGATLSIPAEHEERAVFVTSGAVKVRPNDGGEAFTAGQLLLIKPKQVAEFEAVEAARLMLFGGVPFDEPRHIWWNFVSSSAERIEQAKRDWREGNFAPVPEETETIPLPPDSRPVVARYP